MWPETIIKAMEILPNWLIQIDFECEWKTDRCFITQWAFFWMYGVAMEKHQNAYDAFCIIHSLKQHIEWKIEILKDDSIKKMSNKEAQKEIDELTQKSRVDYDVWKMYLLGT